MVSAALIKLSSPVARGCLVAMSVALLVDAALTVFAAAQYPYLVGNLDELYMPESRPISLAYWALALAALLLSLSTAAAASLRATNYVLVHACITGVFLPVSILVYFSSLAARYKVADYADDYKQMLADYRIVQTSHIHSSPHHQPTIDSPSQESQVSEPPAGTNHQNQPRTRLATFINLIDSLQAKFACCGVESHLDWSRQWAHFLPATCCKQPQRAQNATWAHLFRVDASHEFSHCPEQSAHQLACLAAFREDEQSKFAWLADLAVFLMVLTISNTILSLLLFGLSKTEEMPYETNEHELAIVGVSSKPRPSQPEITGIRHRPSVVQTLAGPSKGQISSLSQAVRFNLSSSPGSSTNAGPSKFSAAARRGSSFL